MLPSSEAANAPSRYFDIGRDKTFPCFCEVCLLGKTEEQMSKRDTRYCEECQVSIESDHKLSGRKYIPLVANIESNLDPSSNDIINKTSPKNTGGMESPIEQEKTKMSTLNPPSLQVDNFRPRGRPKTYKKRPLPDDKIKQLHKEGLGAKAITTLLKKQGIDVSCKTIQRVLSGERSNGK